MTILICAPGSADSRAMARHLGGNEACVVGGVAPARGDGISRISRDGLAHRHGSGERDLHRVGEIVRVPRAPP